VSEVAEEDAHPVRVLVVDDHAVVRGGLVQLLEATDGIAVVGQGTDGAEAVRLAAELTPDVVLMDLQMPVMDGVSATREILAGGHPCEVLVLTSYSDAERIVDALDAGAVGYMLKDAEPDDLVAAVHAVAAGESPLHPRVARQLLTARSRTPAPAEALTAREREVLALVRDGLANKQIARRLGISERTVKAHLTSVFSTIGVADRTAAALWAERHGLTS
jgi:DNA-binding NarL/FixJ family response regulator